jgi:VWFA-related protein
MTRRFITAFLLCAIAASTPAQQSTTIQTETRVVLVDAIVTARNGAYIRDLTQKDFRISEDNKDQTIRSFAFEEASQPRSLVLFFDQSSMKATDQIPALQSASRFIDAETGPNHRMAIVSYDGVLRVRQNFTDNAGRLKKALPGPASRVTGAEQARGGSFLRPLASADTENTVHERGAIAGAIDDTGSRNMLQALRYLATNLAVLPGRKIVVVFAWRIPSSPSQRSDLNEVVDACNKSGVAVYPVDVRPVSVESTETSPRPGLYLSGSDLSPADSGAGDQQLLADLAGRTGGFVIGNSNDLLGGLQSIAAEQDQYYVLTFTPPESKEGSCHTLSVKVDRAGTKVRARNTYCVAKARDLLAGTIMGKDLEKRAADTQAGNMTASIGLPWFYAAPNMARVHLAAEITPGALKFGRVKGRLHAEINLLGMASTGDGGVPARFSDNLKFDFDNEAQVDTWKMKPFHYENEFRIAPGQYKFTLAFGQAGESDATFGKAESPLKIDPWNGAELGMSGLVLSRETHPAGDIGLSLSIGDQTPLVAGGTQVVPYGSDSFAKSGPGFFYFEVFDPNPSSVVVRVRALDRKTGDVKWDSGNTKLPLPANGGKSALPAMAKLPLDALAPGGWRLEVTASDAAGKAASRSVDFEIH